MVNAGYINALKDQITILENKIKRLEKENKQLKQVLNDIVNIVHRSIEIEI